MNILALQSDYPILSLTRLSAPVKIVEVPMIDIRVVEGIEAVVVDEEVMVAPVVEEESMLALVVEEEEPIADVVEEEEIVGVMVEEEVIIGVLECDS